MPEQFQIEQAIFGYREGHNLLTASAPLTPRVRQFLATITDGSGPENSTGFEVAFTGLPVPETDYYALFCTWPAPEMPRPGCVWSHVLLIALADLARIQDLAVLRKLCVRPALPLRLSDYDKPLTLLAPDPAPVLASSQDQGRAVHLLWALYGQPDDGIVLLDEKCAPWETAVFALWSQQWPRLRREFAFSTSSLGDRRLAGVAFDLQIAPVGSERLWGRSSARTLVLSVSPPASASVDLFKAAWVGTALKDMQTVSASTLRQFLFNFGSDIEKPRQGFARLATAYELLVVHPSKDQVERLRSIGEIFPNKAEAVRLKESLIAPLKNLHAGDNLEHAWATASFLFNAREATAYTGVSFDHAGLAPLLWKEKRGEVVSLLGRLVRQKESSAASSFATAIANTLQPSELRFISQRHSEVIPIMISHRPSLAFDDNTWRLPGYTQSQIFEVLSRLALSQEDWAKIAGAMFIAATYVGVREAVENAGPHVMQSAFRWLEYGIAHELLPSRAWREALAAPASKLLVGTEELPPAPLALCAWCVPPETARHSLSASRQDIQRLAEQPLDKLPSPLRVPTAFLLMALGLRAKSDVGVKLVVKGFFPVHDALASGDYSTESWSLLSPELPYLGWWRDWDRCEKLRRAVHDWLSQHVKTGNPLLAAADTAERRELSHRVSTGDTVSDNFLD